MLKRIISFLVLTGLSVLSFSGTKDLSSFDYCRVYGSVYFVKDRHRADFFVYIEEDETMADIAVFKENVDLYADRPGIWFITENEAFADFRLYVEDRKGSQDFTVFYTETESFAGCNL